MYLHICPVCEHRNVRGSRFCNECGAPLQLRFCPACHAAADVLDLKCPACGVTLPQVALSEAADLPPEFANSSPRPAPATDGVDTPPAASLPPATEAKESLPAPAKPAREPQRELQRESQRETQRTSAQREVAAHAPLDPLDPLTAPNFVPLGDPHSGAHGDVHPHGDETAERFAAAKTASIIERLYGKSAPRAQPLQEPETAAAAPEAPAPRRSNVFVSGALMLLGLVLLGLFFAITEQQPPPRVATPSAGVVPPGGAAASNPVSEPVAPPSEARAQQLPPQRQFEGTIRRTPDDDAAATAGTPPAPLTRDAPPNTRAAASPSQGTAVLPSVAAAAPEPASAPPPPRATARTPSTAPTTPGTTRPAATSARTAGPVTSNPPAQVGPCTPQVAALGLCTPAN